MTTPAITDAFDWLLPATAAGAALRAVTVLALYAVFSRAARRVVVRALFVALPVGLLVFAVFKLIPPDLVTAADEGPLVRALVTGGVIAAGWIVTFAVQELRTENQRLSKQTELMVAMRAEILDFLQDSHRDDIAREGRDVAARIRSAPPDDPYLPFVPTAKKLTVSEALAGELPLLRKRPLSAVVAFYTQVNDVWELSKDLQRQDYAALPPERRARAYEHYVDMRLEAEDLAYEAVKLINRALSPFDVEKPPERQKNAVSS